MNMHITHSIVRIQRTAVALGCTLLGMVCLAAAANDPEGWDSGNVEGWTSYDLINQDVVSRLAAVDGAVELSFARQSVKLPPEEYLVRADAGSSAGRFTGDYLAAGVRAVSFSLHCELPVKVSLMLYNAETERLWRYRLPSPPVGEWGQVVIPIDPAILHNVNGVQGWSAFKADVQSVDWVGVAIERNASMDPQTYAIDDFALLGPGPEFAAWMAQFTDPESGEDGRTMLPDGDLDLDGQNNYGEWVAGTSAGDPREFFEVNLEYAGSVSGPEPGAPVVLRWKSEPGRQYVVYRSSDLNEGFTAVSGELAAEPPENTFEDTTATGGGPYFYRLDVKRTDQ